MKKNKILLFGGTFNPIHFGHLIIAQEALERLKFNEVVFIPSANPPHKKNVLSIEHRLKMTELATAGVDYFTVSDIEAKRDGPSYGYDTVMYFKKEYPNTQIYWLIGDDTAPKVKKWYKADKLMNECTFVVAKRNNKSNNKDNDHFIYLNNSIIEMSSTDIRNRIREKKEYATWFFMNEDVEQYIDDNKLYSNKSKI